MLLGAAARLGGFIAGGSVFACLSGLVLGAVLHEGVRRGLAIGFYLTGSAVAAFGFLLGSRPPVRSRSTDGGGLLPFGALGGLISPGSVRWASPGEHKEAINLPAVLVVVGIALILIGVFVDSRHVHH